MPDATARLPRGTFSRGLGISMHMREPGVVVADMPHAATNLNAGGNVHGGAIATFVDTACSYAVLSVYGQECRAVTLDLSVSFLTPARSDLRVMARVIHAGADSAVVEADVRRAEPPESLVATGLATFHIVSA